MTFHLYPRMREPCCILMTHLFPWCLFVWFLGADSIRATLSNLNAHNVLVKKLVKENVVIVNRLSWNVKKVKRAAFCSISLVADKVNLFGLSGNLLDIELFLSFCISGQRSLKTPVSHSIEPSPYGATLSPSDFQARS